MIWECECGNLEYAPIPPEECAKCFRIDSFTDLPEELIEERAKELNPSITISSKLPKMLKPKLNQKSRRRK